MKSDKWNKLVLGIWLGVLVIIAGITAYIDPFLHYHTPTDGLEYPLQYERYQNDGITKHFEYNALITGTSMTENFKASEFDELWNTKTVKIPYSGASYREINEAIVRALEYNNDIKYVVRSVDSNLLIMPADKMNYQNYPDYLYDDNIFNDVNYLLNKEVLPKTLAVVNYTRAGNRTPDFDEYGNWNLYKEFGRDAVFRGLAPLPTFEEEHKLSKEDYRNIRENVQQNVVQVALDNPQVEFYVFFPPYSMCWWDSMVQTKQLNAQLEAEKIAVEEMLAAGNIKIFAFGDNINLLGNLDNYADALHYGEWVNSDILHWMHEGEYQLTKDNYEDYFIKIKNLYEQYDYSQL